MKTTQGALFFEAGINVEQLERDIKRIEDRIGGLGQTAQSVGQKSNDHLALGIGAYFSVNAIKSFTTQLINVRGEFQKTEIAFGTMLKSEEKAQILMKEMIALAAKTPFSLTDVTDGAKRLLAFQVPAEQVVDTLKQMGNVAAGLGVPMGQLIHVYGQVKAQGKLMTNDLYQFMNAGIPIIAELSKVLNKSETEIKEMVSKGKIGFTEIQQVFNNLTKEGGLFYNLMEKQSESLSGKIANLGDAYEQMLNKIGQSNQGVLTTGIDGLTFLVEHYQQVIDALTVLIATYGAYKAALIAVAAAQKIQQMAQMVSSFLSLAKSINTAKNAQTLLNLTMSANPIGAVIAALTALVTIYIQYGEEIQKALGLTDDFTEANKQLAEAWQRLDSEESKEITTLRQLYKTATDEKRSRKERKTATDKLKEAYPALFGLMNQEIFTLNETKKQYNRLTEAIIASAKARAAQKVIDQYAEKQLEKEMELRKKIEEAEKLKYQREKSGYYDKTYTYLVVGGNMSATGNTGKLIKGSQHKKDDENEIQDLKAQLQTLNEETTKTIEKLADIQMEQKEQGAMVDKAWEDAQKRLKSEIATKKEKLQKAQSEKADVYYIQGLKSQIKNAEKDLKAVNEKLDEKNKINTTATAPTGDKKATKGSKRDLAEVYSKGSIKDLEQRISEWNEAIARATTDENGDIKVRERTTNQYGDQKETGRVVPKEVAIKELETLEKAKREIERQLQKQSFEEELTETERQWRVRYLLAQKYGEEVAKAQFPDLQGTSYFDEISKRYKAFNQKIKDQSEVLSEEEVEQWTRLGQILDQLTGEKDPFTNWREGLDQTLSAMPSLTEKIEHLQKVSQSLTPEQKSSGYLAEVNNRLAQAQNDARVMYQNILDQQKSFEEKSLALQREYDQLKASERYQNATESEQKKIDKSYAEQLSALEMEAFKQSGDWELAFQNLDYISQSTIERLITRLEAFKKAKADTLKPTELRELTTTLDRLKAKASANGNPFKNIINSIKGFISTQNNAQASQKAYNDAVAKFGEISEQAAEAQEKLSDAERKSAEERLKLINSLNDSQNTFNQFMSGVNDIADAFGGFSDTAKDVIEDISNIGNAVFDFATSIAKGNIAGMISAGVKLIGSIVKAINGDKKKERAIKQQAKAVKELEEAYKDLDQQLKKMVGADKYNVQRDQIKNLEQQRRLIEEQMRTEQSKKKTDSSKIAEYQSQVKEINRSIEDLKTAIVEDILQTDVKSAAEKVGDALVEAFSRGEDSVKSLETAANDMIKSLLKHQINLQLQKPIKNALDGLLKQAGFDQDGKGTFKGLSKEAIAEFKANVANAGKQMQDFLDATKEIWQGDGLGTNTLQGAIQGMSEETAGVLAGQFNAIRIDTAEIRKSHGLMLDIAKSSLSALAGIENNTSHLTSIRKEIAELNAKIKGTGELKALGL